MTNLSMQPALPPPPDDVFDAIRNSFNYVGHKALVEQQMSPHFQVVEASDGMRELIDGRRVLNFSSNDYLGLRRDRRTVAAAQTAIDGHGTGMGASRLMCGNVPLHRGLEDRISEWLGREDTVIFTTGYDANLGALSAILSPSAVAVCDDGVHASIVDGCRLAGAALKKFRSTSPGSLRLKLDRSGTKPRLVIAESVYSMEGTSVDLSMVLDEARPTGTPVYIDEAHTLGVTGPSGSGVCRDHERGADVTLVSGTFSKSLASCGGFVSGPSDLIGALRVNARSLMFTAGSSPGALGAAAAALEIAIVEDERRDLIRRHSSTLRDGLREMGVPIGAGESHIVPIYVGEPLAAVSCARALFHDGINVGVAIHPAVPRNRSLLRLCVTAAHTSNQIAECVEKVAAMWGSFVAEGSSLEVTS